MPHHYQSCSQKKCAVYRHTAVSSTSGSSLHASLKLNLRSVAARVCAQDRQNRDEEHLFEWNCHLNRRRRSCSDLPLRKPTNQAIRRYNLADKAIAEIQSLMVLNVAEDNNNKVLACALGFSRWLWCRWKKVVNAFSTPLEKIRDISFFLSRHY